MLGWCETYSSHNNGASVSNFGSSDDKLRERANRNTGEREREKERERERDFEIFRQVC